MAWALGGAIAIEAVGVAMGSMDESRCEPLSRCEPVSLTDPLAFVGYASLAWSLALLVPGLAVAAWRLHDTGRSGWLVVLSFLPALGWIVLALWCVLQGDREANVHGAPPD